MSWANVRAELQSIIDALTPSTAGQGQGKSFVHSKKKRIDAIAEDRGYLVRKNDGERSDVPINQPGDYLCEVDIQTWYDGQAIADDEDRIAEDGTQIIEAILLVDHADFQCWVDLPSQAIDEDDNGNYIAAITGRCRYKG